MPQELNENIKKQYNLEKYKNPIFFEKTEDPLITVQVPSTGGGLTNTQIPESYLIDYLVKQGKEYDSSKQYRVYDPKVVEKAKSENPERFADPLNNMLNNLMMGGAGLTRAFTTKALQQSGKALTDLLSKLSFSNTYTSGIGLASVPTTGAVIGDAALATATMIPVTNDISKNGLNLVNGAETTLGLLPVFGPVYDNTKSGIKVITSTIKKPLKQIKLAKELNNSIKNTQFINTPVYHTTTYTGNDLRPWSRNEWGLHVTPDSNTAQRIAKQIPGSHIKEGIFTFTDNTLPVRISDQGSFQRGFGDFDYTGVEQFNFLQPRQAENMLAGSKSPSYVYNNVFEKGGDSFVITNPNNVHFSKNNFVEKEIPLKVDGSQIILPSESQYVHSIETFGSYYLGEIGDDIIFLKPNDNTFSFRGQEFKFENKDQYLKGLKKLHDEYVSNLTELQKQLYININTAYDSSREIPKFDDIYLLTKRRTKDLINDFYLSDEYKDRFLNVIDGETDPTLMSSPNDQYHRFISNLIQTHNNYQVGIFKSNNSFGKYYHEPPMISLNAKSFYYDPDITIHHEFGHGAYSPIYKDIDEWLGALSVIEHNDNLIGDASKQLLSDHNLYPDEIGYFTDPNELRQRVIPAVEEMFTNGWTVEEAYDKSKALNRAGLKKIFNKDYILKLLGGMLSTTPLILNENNSKKKL